MPGIIMLFELLAAHLLSDKDFSPEVKNIAQIVFLAIAAVYLIFGLIL